VNSPSTILRSRATLLAWLVLPALIFRAMVPAGFMPMRGEHGELAIMFCPGVTDAPASVAGDPHAHHHMGGEHSAGEHGSVHVPCPYALSAGPALGWAIDSCVATAQRTEFTGLRESFGIVAATIERAQSARAPPFLLRA
jgi:hypothetical protein